MDGDRDDHAGDRRPGHQLGVVPRADRDRDAVSEPIPRTPTQVTKARSPGSMSDLRLKVDQAIDAHCVAAIDAASTQAGAVGTNLAEQVRNGIAAMNALGSNPTIVALSPENSVELDLFATGGG